MSAWHRSNSHVAVGFRQHVDDAHARKSYQRRTLANRRRLARTARRWRETTPRRRTPPCHPPDPVAAWSYGLPRPLRLPAIPLLRAFCRTNRAGTMSRRRTSPGQRGAGRLALTNYVCLSHQASCHVLLDLLPVIRLWHAGLSPARTEVGPGRNRITPPSVGGSDMRIPLRTSRSVRLSARV